ncbi:MAG: CaiB/BaiF CoA-transferase family protein [Burkholderiaceae bacterium]
MENKRRNPAGHAGNAKPPIGAPGSLAGLRVLELGQLIAGPFAARMLGDFGADVIKIEAPDRDGIQGGDPLRKWRKLHPDDPDGTSLWWYVQARNKRSVTINLRTPAGQELVRKLAATSDIIIENFRPGAMEKWGLSYESLAKENPGLIFVRLSGYGQTGPYRERPGFGSIAEAMGGMRYVTGFPDRPPVRMNLSIGDTLAALHAVIGALSALRHRYETGEGQVVDVALYEAVFNVMESTLPEYAAYGMVRERTGTNLTGIVPSNTYPTGDGGHIVIGANGDSIFKRLMRAIGRDDLGNDPALADNAGRAAQHERIDGAIGEWTGSRPLAESLEVLEKADVPSGKIYSAADWHEDPQFVARQMIQQMPMPDGTPISIPAPVPKLSKTPGDTKWLGPTLGEHTDEILAELGLDAAQLAALRADGAI